ncbi:tetratricopeptide repeat protein, partial [bacterium]|nr:tetratricopeptide repeat protein [bacterium]
YKWFIIAYLSGLSLAHHPSILALFPALIFLMVLERKEHRWRPVGWMAMLFVIGFSVYIYLPVRASLSPIANWGHPVNLQLLVNHITGSQYQQAAEFTLSNLFASLKLFFSLLLSNWWWFGVLLVFGGIALGIARQAKRTVFLLILLSSNLLLVSFYRIPDIDPYYLPGLFACFLLITDAIYHFWNKQKKLMIQQGIVVTGGIAVLLLLVLNYGRMDKSDHTLAEDYGRLILDTAGSGTLFTTDDNSSFPALYLRYAEGYRSDIEVYDKAVRFKALVDEVHRRTGTFLGDYLPARDAFLSQADGNVHFVKSYFPFNPELTDIAQIFHSNGILYSSDGPSNRLTMPEFKMGDNATDFKSRQILVNMELCRAHDAIQPGKTNQLKAIQAFQKAIDYLEDEPRASMLNQLGVSFRHLRQRELALETYGKALTAPRITKTEKAEIRFNMSNIYKDRGNELAGLNDFGAALQAFVTALEYDPENATLLYNIGVIYVNFLKQPERGLPYLKAYLTQNPSDQNVRDLIKSIQP